MTQLSPDVKKLMSQARDAFSPSEERLEAVRNALAARLANSGGNGGGSTGGAASGFWGTGTWLAVGVLALLAAGGIALNSGAFSRDGGDTTEVSTPVAVSDVADPSLVAPSEARDTASAEIAVPPLRAAPASASVRMVESGRSRGLRVHRAKRLALSAAEPDTKVAAFAPTSAVQSAATAARGAAPAPRNAAAPDSLGTAAVAERTVSTASLASSSETARAPVANAEVVVDESLAREIALLRRARQALAAGQPGAALRLADEHAALFPRGTLRQERLAARALALCALGRLADARAATQALEDVAPRSPHLMRIRAACPTQISK